MHTRTPDAYHALLTHARTHTLLRTPSPCTQRRRRIREGAFAPGEGASAELPSGPHAPLSSTSSEKLAEIHAAETRLSAPPEVLRRRVRAQMPPGDGDVSGRFRNCNPWGGSLSGSFGHAPRTSLGRNRWSLPTDADAAAHSALAPAEESAAVAARRAVATRTLAAGTRALLYGSALAVVAAVAGARAAAQAWDIRSEEDLRRVAAAVVAPRAAAAKEALVPCREWFTEHMSGYSISSSLAAADAAGGEGGAAGFGARLRKTGVFRDLAAAAAARRSAPPPPAA
jgi:hypothetical protein